MAICSVYEGVVWCVLVVTPTKYFFSWWFVMSLTRIQNLKLIRDTFWDTTTPHTTYTNNNSNAYACDLWMFLESQNLKILKNVENYEKNPKIKKKSQNLKMLKNVENFEKNLKIWENAKISKSYVFLFFFVKKLKCQKISKSQNFEKNSKSQNLKEKNWLIFLFRTFFLGSNLIYESLCIY